MYISISYFKEILHTAKENNVALKVKTHTGWSRDFLHIIGFIASIHDQQNRTFGGVVLSNVSETEGIMINNIATISAIELDGSCGLCEKNKIYEIGENAPVPAAPVVHDQNNS